MNGCVGRDSKDRPRNVTITLSVREAAIVVLYLRSSKSIATPLVLEELEHVITMSGFVDDCSDVPLKHIANPVMLCDGVEITL